MAIKKVSKYASRLKRRKIQRLERLMDAGLTRMQALPYLDYALGRIYMRRFMRQIVSIGKDAKKLSDSALRNIWRDIYDRATTPRDRGDGVMVQDYIPPKRKTTGHHKKLPDGSADYSGEREYKKSLRAEAKASQPKTPSHTGDRAIWIAELRQTLVNTTNPQRRSQIQKQIDRLGG